MYAFIAKIAVTVEDRDYIEREITKIEQRHRIPEFHWVNEPWKLRAAFLSDAARLPFTVKVAIFRNPISPVPALEWSLKHVLVEKRFYAILIDGEKPKWVERQLKKTLRDKGISVRKLKTVRRSASPGIRLADAIAGLVRAYYDDPQGKAKPLWENIRKKITTQLVGGQTDR